MLCHQLAYQRWAKVDTTPHASTGRSPCIYEMCTSQQQAVADLLACPYLKQRVTCWTDSEFTHSTKYMLLLKQPGAFTGAVSASVHTGFAGRA